VLVGLVVVTIGTSRWRWLVLLHPAITIFVVAATANHFWLDGIVAIALLALAIAVQRAARALVRKVGIRTAAAPARESTEAVPVGD
jgi:hypothetical protein